MKPGVAAKDIILALIAQDRHRRRHGLRVRVHGGSAIRALSMEERMTVCNMSIEGGRRAGLMAPDETTFEYLAGSPVRAAGRGMGRGGGRWKTLPTDEGAKYDHEHYDRRAIRSSR